MTFKPPKWLMWDEDTINSYNKKEDFYQYVYGIKDLAIRHKEYEKASVYVSKVFNIEGNIAEVSLITDEFTPEEDTNISGISKQDTSLEYYITFKENPDIDDWKPILPKGKEGIENELLIFQDKNSAKLRFKCNNQMEKSVYKNGVRLDSQFWSYGSDNTIRIDKGYDEYSVYTISYYPNLDAGSPWDIELGPQDKEIIPYRGTEGTSGEVFYNGTDRNGQLKLSRHPYIDYSRINNEEDDYQPIKVVLEAVDDNHKIAGLNGDTIDIVMPYETDHTSVITKNVTDYKTLKRPVLKPYNTKVDTATGQPINPQFEYYQSGRSLYFTETFNNTRIISNQQTNHGDAIINVAYDYLKVSCRLKVIARNTSNSSKSVTPVLKNYSLIFKVVK